MDFFKKIIVKKRAYIERIKEKSMKKFQNAVIGFGKAGKTLAGELASKGQSVILIEKSDRMYGGTCINVGCIPSKSIERRGRLTKIEGGSFEEKSKRYAKAIEQKRNLTSMLREKNLQKVIAAGAEVIVGTASFIGENDIEILLKDGNKERIKAEKIFINTGAQSFVPPISGLKESKFVYTSDGMLELDTLPKEFVIVGGGYISLEFASYYENFGSHVTIIQNDANFIPREDKEMAQSILESMKERNIDILFETDVLSFKDKENTTEIGLKNNNGEFKLEAQAVLIATGRRPNVEFLQPEKANVALTQRGAIEVDENLQTTNKNIWAMGDVAGGLQFTYISLDDYRIVKSQILSNGERTTQNRNNVPYSVFIDPPFSRIGMSEEEALNAGLDIKIGKLASAAIPKAQVVDNPTGLLKVIIDAKNDKILGAHLFCAESYEMINLIKLAMDSGMSYQTLRDSIYTHPTMSEAFNDLFQI